MTKSSKGTLEKPGKNVKQKSGLNRSILSSGWYDLEQKLGYKSEVVLAPAQYTSQRCSKCGNINKENRKTQAQFKCLSCGYSGNSDVNAALNIAALGRRAIRQGGRSGYRPDELSRNWSNKHSQSENSG